MKAYKMIIEDEENAYKVIRPADSVKQLKSMYGGNGEFVSIKEVTSEYPINLDMLRSTLAKACYGTVEIDIIISIMQRHYEGSI